MSFLSIPSPIFFFNIILTQYHNTCVLFIYLLLIYIYIPVYLILYCYILIFLQDITTEIFKQICIFQKLCKMINATMTRSFYRSWMEQWIQKWIEVTWRSSICYARKNLNRLLPVSLELTVSQICKVCSVTKHGNNRNLLHKTSSNEAMRWRQ